MDVKTIERCRNCTSSMEKVMDLGEQCVNGFPTKEELVDWPKVPLELMLCGTCKLLQLRHTIPPDMLYRKFWYRSGITNTMRRHLMEIVVEGIAKAKLEPGDSVLDIGCNDGTMLRQFAEAGLWDIETVGFEPAQNLIEEAESEGTSRIIPDYFNPDVFIQRHQFKLITAIAMFYDLEDPRKFLTGVASLLHPGGVFCLQMNYLGAMIRNGSFDNIGHEHLCYYSLRALEDAFASSGMYVYHAEENDVNGGSIRCWAVPRGDLRSKVPVPFTDSYNQLREKEKEYNLKELQTYVAYGEKIRLIGSALKKVIGDEVGLGRQIYLCGASTRGNTLLQTFGIDSTLIMGAGERDPHKHGRYTPGTRIPIVTEEEAREKAHVMLVLPWHFADEIIVRENKFLEGGGGLIFPLPEPRIVDKTEIDGLMTLWIDY